MSALAGAADFDGDPAIETPLALNADIEKQSREQLPRTLARIGSYLELSLPNDRYCRERSALFERPTPLITVWTATARCRTID